MDGVQERHSLCSAGLIHKNEQCKSLCPKQGHHPGSDGGISSSLHHRHESLIHPAGTEAALHTYAPAMLPAWMELRWHSTAVLTHAGD